MSERRMREQHHQDVMDLQKEKLQLEEKIENIVDKYDGLTVVCLL